MVRLRSATTRLVLTVQEHHRHVVHYFDRPSNSALHARHRRSAAQSDIAVDLSHPIRGAQIPIERQVTSAPHPPARSFLGGFRKPAPVRAPTSLWPASETLHNRRHATGICTGPLRSNRGLRALTDWPSADAAKCVPRRPTSASTCCAAGDCRRSLSNSSRKPDRQLRRRGGSCLIHHSHVSSAPGRCCTRSPQACPSDCSGGWPLKKVRQQFEVHSSTCVSPSASALDAQIRHAFVGGAGGISDGLYDVAHGLLLVDYGPS